MDKFEIIFETRNHEGYPVLRRKVVEALDSREAEWKMVKKFGTDLTVLDLRQILEE